MFFLNSLIPMPGIKVSYPKIKFHSLPLSFTQVLTKCGGFPLSITRSSISSSRIQLIKLGIFLIMASLGSNLFNIAGYFLPEPRTLIYLDIFKSVGFSNMDFFVSIAMFNTVIIFTLVVFFALEIESKRLESLCLEMEEVNAKPFCRISYRGKGKLTLFVPQTQYSKEPSLVLFCDQSVNN